MSALVIILLIIVLVPLALMLLVRFFQRREDLTDTGSLVCMLVSLPRDNQRDDKSVNEPVKDFKDLIAPMEQFFGSLTTIIHQRNFLDWLFSNPAHVSFEIISSGGVISFAIVAPKRVQQVIERQLQSYFPHAEITLGPPPRLFTKETPVVAGAIFQQAKNFVLPIKTYQTLEADPLQAITNAMTKLPYGAAIQLLIRPTGENWRLHTNIAAGHVQQGKAHLVNRTGTARVLGQIGEVVKPTAPIKDLKVSPEQEMLLKGLQEKGSKTGFEAVLRVVVTDKDDASAAAGLTTIISAFSQFYAPQYNSLKYRKTTGQKISREYLLRSFNSAPKMLLNVEELSSLFHLPTRVLETPGVKWVGAKKLPAPANLPKAGIVIGESVYRSVKQYVRLQDEDRRRHIFMIGKTGVGKTTLFETMIEQDMAAGKGLCFIDPLGDAIESLLKKVPTERAKDVVLFDPSDTQYPFGLNLLEYQKPEERDFLIQEVIEIFYKLFDPNRTGIVGPQWEHWARNAALTVMNNPGGGTLIDLPRLFTDDAFRDASVANLTDPVVKAFWDQQLAKTADFHKSEMYNYFISKFGRFMTNDLMRNIIGQKESSFNFRQLMDDGKILFVNLAKGKIGEINSNLLGLILVSKIQIAAFSRANIAETDRKDFYLYVDEFQNFTTDTFATILAEARKYRLGLNITNQYFAQLTEKIRDAVIGNVGTLISYRIGAEDAEFLAREMVGLTIEDFTNLDRFQTYVKLLVDLTPTKPFSMNGLKTPGAGTVEMANWIRANNRSLYAKGPVQILAPNASAAKPTT
ncbi:MAG TPA: type IV secretion system DNA-binding domain-containing protein [Candidatus Saccharimonadales bacterium]|nr:type IV secretion system DNA-binding domain-containing protein [Candidatus Saccharimonadales bacterium]